MPQLIGLTNVLVDAIYQVPDEVVSEFGLNKGEVSDDPEKVALARKFAAKTLLQPALVPGGSVGNVMANAARAGIETSVLGAGADDDAGRLYRKGLAAAGAQDHVITRDGVTGRVFSFVTPDAQRTMVFDLGCAHDYHIADVPAQELCKASVFHTSVYELQGRMRDPALHAIHTARAAGVKIGLDLADSRLVSAEHDFYHDLVKEGIHYLFGNEQEMEAFIGTDDAYVALLELATMCEVGVITLGRNGAYLTSEQGDFHVPSTRTTLRDTTGAGDAHRAGFYYGLLHSNKVNIAGICASYLAARVCETIGPRLQENIINLEIIATSEMDS